MKQGKALKHNIGIAKWYNDELQTMCKVMFDNTKNEIMPLFVKYNDVAMDSISFDFTTTINKLIKRFKEYYLRYGEKLAKRFLERQLKYTRLSVKKAIEPLLKKDVKYTLKGKLVTDTNKDIVKLAIYNNVSLITSIPDQYFKDIIGIVTRSIEYGANIQQIKEQLMNIEGVTERRAKLIAYDQTRKIYSALAVQQVKDAGFNKVKWLHSNGDKIPRCLHVKKWDRVSEPPNGLNGYVFDINKPPVIQKAKGTRPEVRGFPGELINCKCFLAPVIED